MALAGRTVRFLAVAGSGEAGSWRGGYGSTGATGGEGRHLAFRFFSAAFRAFDVIPAACADKLFELSATLCTFVFV